MWIIRLIVGLNLGCNKYFNKSRVEFHITTEPKELILDDIPQVVYAPVKVFKKIIENPKYLGALIILLLFIGIQIGYEYVQFSKTYTENTSPTVDQFTNVYQRDFMESSSNVTL